MDPTPPARVPRADPQGEGRAAAQSRALLLGEALAPLRVVFKHGADAAAEPPPPPSAIKLEVCSRRVFAFHAAPAAPIMGPGVARACVAA